MTAALSSLLLPGANTVVEDVNHTESGVQWRVEAHVWLRMQGMFQMRDAKVESGLLCVIVSGD